MKKIIYSLLFSYCCLCCYGAVAQAEKVSQPSGNMSNPSLKVGDRVVLGRLENVYYADVTALKGVPFVGKIDTGADSTSMHAESIHLSSNNPQFKSLHDQALMDAIVQDLRQRNVRWKNKEFERYQVTVKFIVHHPYTGKPTIIERPLVRITAIRSRVRHHSIYRPAIHMPLTIAGKTVHALVNLTKRKQFAAPLLIGKTFLRHNAWVLPGYNYLQQQADATLISDRQAVNIGKASYDLGFTLKSNYTNVHATQITIDNKTQQVSFVLVDKQGHKQAMQLPLVRMLPTSDGKKPMVELPVTIDGQTSYWLVYLRDRTNAKTRVAVGKDVLNKFYNIAVNNSTKNTKSVVLAQTEQFKLSLTDNAHISTSAASKTMTLDGQLSFNVTRPWIEVPQLSEIYQQGKHKVVQFAFAQADGHTKLVTQRVVKIVKMNGKRYPIIRATVALAGVDHTFEIGLKPRASDRLHAFLYFPAKQLADTFFAEAHPSDHLQLQILQPQIIINARTSHLLTPPKLTAVGDIETVQVDGLALPAKLDTGADLSAINAQHIHLYKQNGQQMVRFTYKNELGTTKQFVKPVIGYVRIQARKGEHNKARPMVNMQVKLGDIEQNIRVGLQDRHHFHRSMILGLNFLKSGLLVSSGQQYLATHKLDKKPLASKVNHQVKHQN